MLILKILKWISGLSSGALSLLLLLYIGIKDEKWAIVTDDGYVLMNKTAGICLIIVWAVVGALFLLFDFLYKRANKSKGDNKNK